jgi:hypothetical protein
MDAATMVTHLQTRAQAVLSDYNLQIAAHVGDPSAYQAHSEEVTANLALTKIGALSDMAKKAATLFHLHTLFAAFMATAYRLPDKEFEQKK